MIRCSCTFSSRVSRVILPRALKSVPVEEDKALFLWKKRELIEFSGTSRSSCVCKFNESVEVTVTSPLSSHVSFCICLACVTFSIRFALLSLDYSISTSRSSITVISLGSPALIFAIFLCFSFSSCLAGFDSAAISAGNLSEMNL